MLYTLMYSTHSWTLHIPFKYTRNILRYDVIGHKTSFSKFKFTEIPSTFLTAVIGNKASITRGKLENSQICII